MARKAGDDGFERRVEKRIGEIWRGKGIKKERDEIRNKRLYSCSTTVLFV
jgi:hypothetical protein